MLSRFNFLFPLWAVLLSLFAYIQPALFIPLKPAIVYLLALVMFGMGMTLALSDLKKLVQLKLIVCIGLLLQFSIMPFTAWSISLVMGLSTPLLTGMVLVGSCPGGTASNVICYLANGNVALSILLTTLSTVLAIMLTPFLTWIYLGHSIEVPIFEMMLSVLKIVIIPVALGIFFNYRYGQRFRKHLVFFPSLSVIAICLIIAIIVALNKNNLQHVGVIIVIAVIAHNVIGLICGYWISKFLKYDTKTCKTLAIEVGMQNSGLAVALASEYFKVLAALPGAIFSIWHNLSGAVLATVWSRNKLQEL